MHTRVLYPYVKNLSTNKYSLLTNLPQNIITNLNKYKEELSNLELEISNFKLKIHYRQQKQAICKLLA